nr:LOB domain-containing protein 39 isoform X2 [Arachis hypogaea]
MVLKKEVRRISGGKSEKRWKGRGKTEAVLGRLWKILFVCVNINRGSLTRVGPHSEMSCNGCRVLRKGCSDMCPLRTCLHWIPSPQAQAHATLFLAKFFGRSDLFSFISSVPHNNRPACGRTINPVNGAVGLLSTGNWHLCEAALRTVLTGGVLTALPEEVIMPVLDDSSASHAALHFNNTSLSEASKRRSVSGVSTPPAVSVVSGEPSEMSFDDGICSHNQRKLLNLFV